MLARWAFSILFVGTSAFAGDAQSVTNSAALHGPIRLAFICFLKGEDTSGLNKICFYRCPTGDAAITIKSYELCPLSVER